ncbi:hypothetical protein JHK85_001031 [Glycine max]|nr:hypothetical protein JHK85_001031 [Glycine max]KAG5088385.1 hypothetical protein JHK86_000997 [Glycine max]
MASQQLINGINKESEKNKGRNVGPKDHTKGDQIVKNMSGSSRVESTRVTNIGALLNKWSKGPGHTSWSVNFWRDCWIPRSFPLIDSYAEAIPESKMEKKVSDYVGINGNWLEIIHKACNWVRAYQEAAAIYKSISAFNLVPGTEEVVDEVDSKGPRSKRGYHRGGVGDVDEDEVGGSDIEREIEKKSEMEPKPGLREGVMVLSFSSD